MRLKSFTIPEDVAERLEQEENQSKFISDLLREAFRFRTETYEEKLKRIEEQKQMQIEIYEREKEKIEEKLTIEKKEREIEVEIEEKKKERDNNLRKNMIDNFKLLSGRDIKEEELKEALRLWDEEEDFNMASFIDKCNE